MEIRPFVPEDAEETAALIAGTLRKVNIKDYDPAYIERIVSSHSAEDLIRTASEGHLYVACEEGEILGCGAVTPPAENGGAAWLQTVFVRDGYLGRGIGRRLMETLEGDEISLSAGRTELAASVTAKDFYRRLGYSFRDGKEEPDEGQVFRMEKRV